MVLLKSIQLVLEPKVQPYLLVTRSVNDSNCDKNNQLVVHSNKRHKQYMKWMDTYSPELEEILEQIDNIINSISNIYVGASIEYNERELYAEITKYIFNKSYFLK